MSETPQAGAGSRPSLPVTTDQRVDPFRPPTQRRGMLQGWTWTRTSPVLAVAIGGALGGACRYAVGQALAYDEKGIPWPTLTVNATGSFVLAALLVLVLDLWPPRRYVRPFFCTGFLGAFTTFSALAVEVDRRVSDGAAAIGLAYLALTLAAGFAAAGLGLVVGHAVVRRGQSRTANDEELR